MLSEPSLPNGVYHRKRHKGLKINWGRGRLLPFESAASFFAKFRILNGLPSQAANKFLTDICYPAQWRADIQSQFASRNLAKLLDEKNSIVKTLFQNELDVILCFGVNSNNIPLNLHLIETKHHREFSYCPICIQAGYHASFHEYSWLKKCPIHCEDIVRDSRIFYRSNLNEFYEYAGHVVSTLHTACPKWLDLNLQHPAHHFIESANFDRFKRWVRSAQRTAREINASRLAALPGDEYCGETLEIFWQRLAWADPIPKGIRSLLNIPRADSTQPLIKKFPQVATQQVKEVLKHGSLQDLLWVYKKTMALANEMPIYRQAAIAKVELLRTRHEICRCQWGKEKNGPWVRTDSSGWPYWLLRCPFTIVINDILENWIYFHGDFSGVKRWDMWMIYLAEVKRFWNHDFFKHIQQNASAPAKKAGVGDSFAYQPVIEFAFDNNLKSLIEALINFEFMNYMDEADRWLQQIDSGIEPYNVINSPTRSHLMDSPEGIYLLTWQK